MFEITKTTNITNTKLALEHRYCDEGDSGDGYTCRCVPGSVGTDVANGAATCVENTCDAFEFTEGVVGDTSSDDACSDNIVLTAVSDNSCDLTCDEGYIESSSTHVCETGSVTFSAFSNSRVSDYQTVTLSKSYVVFESANRENFNIITHSYHQKVTRTQECQSCHSL